jgi:hypothetical protein
LHRNLNNLVCPRLNKWSALRMVVVSMNTALVIVRSSLLWFIASTTCRELTGLFSRNPWAGISDIT